MRQIHVGTHRPSPPAADERWPTVVERSGPRLLRPVRLPSLGPTLVGAALVVSACAQAAPVITPTADPLRAAPTVAATAAATPVATNDARIENFAFSPPAIVVTAGSTVTWTNHDVEQHTVTARDKSFDSDVIAGDKSFTFSFTKPGTYDYFCQIHPNMVGKVVVVAK